MTGICQYNKHKMLQINSVPDHIHILTGLNPQQSISDFCRIIKSETTKWINEQRFCKIPFAWQEGYGAFSYSKSHVPDVIRYIQNQEVHHKKESFLDEYRRLLKMFEIDYDEQYMFKDPV